MFMPPPPIYPKEIYPKGFLKLCNREISGVVERTTVFLHTLMLEVGYIPKDVDEYDVYQRMPENWRGNHTYHIYYYHKSIPNIFCHVTCVRLQDTVAIYGLLEDETDEKNTVFLRIRMTDPLNLLCDVNQLAIEIKDGFCFPLLVLLQERVNFKPSFGLGGLINDCKRAILKYLDVKSVVSISEVNKEFHDQANSPSLWKHLFTRDFASDVSVQENSSSSEDWKEKYKEEYIQRKIMRSRRTPRPLFYPFESPVPDDLFGPPITRPIHATIYDPQEYVDASINFYQCLEEAFPHLRDRFRSSTHNIPFGIPPRRHDPSDPWFF